MKDKKTRPNIIEAFNAAIQGIIYTFKYERNMKIHYLIAVAVLIVSLRFNLNKLEMMILILLMQINYELRRRKEIPCFKGKGVFGQRRSCMA